MIGTVKEFDPRRGVGQITPDGGRPEVAVHTAEVERAGFARLEPGDRVRFDIQTDRALRRVYAVNLSRVAAA